MTHDQFINNLKLVKRYADSIEWGIDEYTQEHECEPYICDLNKMLMLQIIQNLDYLDYNLTKD